MRKSLVPAVFARLQAGVARALIAVLAVTFAWAAGTTGGSGDALEEVLARKFDVCADEDVRDA